MDGGSNRLVGQTGRCGREKAKEQDIESER